MDNKGQLTRWNDPIPEGKPPPADAVGAKRGAEAANGTNGRRRSDSASTSTSSRGGGNDLFRKEDDEDEFDRFNAGDGTNEFGVAERKAAEEENRQLRMSSAYGDDIFAPRGKRKADCELGSRSLVRLASH